MEYRTIEGFDGINLTDVARLMRMTYRVDKRSEEQVEKSCRNSSCLGVVANEKPVGFTGVNSDCRNGTQGERQ